MSEPNYVYKQNSHPLQSQIDFAEVLVAKMEWCAPSGTFQDVEECRTLLEYIFFLGRDYQKGRSTRFFTKLFGLSKKWSVFSFHHA